MIQSYDFRYPRFRAQINPRCTKFLVFDGDAATYGLNFAEEFEAETFSYHLHKRYEQEMKSSKFTSYVLVLQPICPIRDFSRLFPELGVLLSRTVVIQVFGEKNLYNLLENKDLVERNNRISYSGDFLTIVRILKLDLSFFLRVCLFTFF